MENEILLRIVARLDKMDGELTELKTGQSDMRTQISDVGKSVNQKIDSVEQSLNQKIDSVEQSLNQKIDSVEQSLNQKIDSVEQSLNQKIDSVEKSLQVQIVDMRGSQMLSEQNMTRQMGAIMDSHEVVMDIARNTQKILHMLEAAQEKYDSEKVAVDVTLINHEKRIVHLERQAV